METKVGFFFLSNCDISDEVQWEIFIGHGLEFSITSSLSKLDISQEVTMDNI